MDKEEGKQFHILDFHFHSVDCATGRLSFGSIHAKSTKACGDQVADFVQNCTSYRSLCEV